MTDDALISFEEKQRRDALAEAYADRFTVDLERYVRAELPMTLSNTEYAAGTSGMLTALTRVLGETTVAFSETYGVDRERMPMVINSMVAEALAKSYAALDQGNAPTGKPN